MRHSSVPEGLTVAFRELSSLIRVFATQTGSKAQARRADNAMSKPRLNRLQHNKQTEASALQVYFSRN